MGAVTVLDAAPDQIRDLHAKAVKHAGQAVEYARQAGELLLQVKAALPHGQFEAWVAQHLPVTMRQAQRYMNVARGKPTPIRALAGKSDTVSQVAERVAAFLPATDCFMYTELSGRYYFVEPSTQEGFHFVSCFQPYADDGTEVLDYIKRPIKRDFAELVLQHLGLADPASAAWRVLPAEPVSSALSMEQAH